MTLLENRELYCSFQSGPERHVLGMVGDVISCLNDRSGKFSDGRVPSQVTDLRCDFALFGSRTTSSSGRVCS